MTTLHGLSGDSTVHADQVFSTPHQQDTLWETIEDKRIVLLVGSGGVGKTTVSASLALNAALRGKKVLAVTIDPAKRLANSLGLKEIGNVETKIDLDAVGLKTGNDGELWVMMLDVKRSLDELIRRYAPNSEVSSRILENNIYRAVSDSLAGTEEFVALGKLYELQNQGRFDLIVVDTAPTRHALDFFESPARLMNLLDMRIIQWFLKPLDLFHKIGFKTFRRGTSFLIERVERTIGLTFFTEIATFLQNFEGMFEKLSDRANRINMVLKDKKLTALGLVTSAERGAIDTSLFLSRKLLQFDMPLSFVIVNRIHPLYRLEEEKRRILNDFAFQDNHRADFTDALHAGVSDTSLDDLERYSLIFKDVMRTALPAARGDLANVTRLRQGVPRSLLFFAIPFFESDVCDVSGLCRINSHLFPSEQE